MKKARPAHVVVPVMTNARRAHAALDEIERLYRWRFHAFVYTVTAIVGEVETARDVVQEAFAAAIRRRESYRASGSVEAWLWTIVINTARDERRARSRAHGREPVHLDPSPNGLPEHDDDAVRRAVAALPERQRLVVFLRYYADLDYAEIARVLGLSPGTVGSTLSSARSDLIRALADLEEVH